MDTGPTTDPATARAAYAASPDLAGGAGDAARPWRTLAAPATAPVEPALPSLRRVVVRLLVGALVVIAVVAVGGSLAARRLAEHEALNDAANTADVLAEAVVQPALSEKLAAGDPVAVAAFDRLVRDRVLGDGVVRVKLWTPGGTVRYADQSELVGQTFALDAAQRRVLAHPSTQAEISDLDQPENRLDTAVGGRLLEVYRPVWTRQGTELLFEIYAPYDTVRDRTASLTRGFAGVTLTSLLLLLVLLAPLLARLLSRLREAHRQREVLLERAVSASEEERRRIAASLHDGPVQELAGTSFVVAGAAERAEREGRPGLADDLRNASGAVRGSIRALRTLLVDIYPPSLEDAGLAAALGDLVQGASGRGVAVGVVEVDPDAAQALDEDGRRLVHRVAREIVLNTVQHAAPATFDLRLARVGEQVVLETADDGPGFDPGADGPAGHFGLRSMSDAATAYGAGLALSTAYGVGTRWRLSVPTSRAGGERR